MNSKYKYASAGDLPLSARVEVIISHAAQQGLFKLRMSDLYEIFNIIATGYPHIFPDLSFVGSPGNVHSKYLEDAFNERYLLPHNFRIYQGREYLKLTRKKIELDLKHLIEDYGQTIIDSLQPVGYIFAILAQLINPPQTQLRLPGKHIHIVVSPRPWQQRPK